MATNSVAKSKQRMACANWRSCEGCNGDGIRAPAIPACKIPGLDLPWIVVERCDACDRFNNDLDAALSRYNLAGWFRCADGGWHALANLRSRRKKGAVTLHKRDTGIKSCLLPT